MFAMKYITKEMLLSTFSQEQIMERYIGVRLTNKSFKSPFYNDTKASCVYYYKGLDLMYKDFGSYDHGDCIWAATKVLGKNNIYTRIYNDMLTNSFVKTSHWLDKRSEKVHRTSDNVIDIMPIKRELSTVDKSYWFDRYGIKSNTLNRFNVYACDQVVFSTGLIMAHLDNDPIYAYEEDKGIIKTYRPLNTNGYKWRNNYNKSDKPIVEGHKQLIGSDTLIIQKAKKECMFLNQIGIDAVANPSETSMIPEQYMNEYINKYKSIYVMLDNDTAGIQTSKMYRDKYDLPVIFTPIHKNITDWYENDRNEPIRWVQQLN